MDEPELPYLTEITDDLLAQMLLLMPFKAILSLIHSSKTLANNVGLIINDYNFWYMRIRSRSTVPYRGPHPMTLALLLDYTEGWKTLDEEKLRKKNTIIARLMCAINIPEFVTFFINGGFGLGITKAEAYWEIVNQPASRLLVDKSILVDALAETRDDNPVGIIIRISGTDLATYILPSKLEFTEYEAKIIRRRIAKARIYDGDLPYMTTAFANMISRAHPAFYLREVEARNKKRKQLVQPETLFEYAVTLRLQVSS